MASQVQAAVANRGEGSLRRPGSSEELATLQQGIPGQVKAALDKIKQGGEAKWEKDELLDVIYWWRQIIGPLAGLLWGVLPLTGLYGFVSFVLLNVMLTVTFYKSLLKIDEEDFGGHNDLLGEGMAGSISFFLVAWVLSYTALHT